MTRLKPATTSAFLALGIAFVPVAAQEPSSPIPSTEVKLRKEIYRDQHLTAYLLEIPPHNASVMHRHNTDMLGVFVSGGSTKGAFNDRATSRFRTRSSDRDTRPVAPPECDRRFASGLVM
jgi:hypothetical protein